MKIFYYLLHFLCYVTFILPATCTLVNPDKCSKSLGQCKRRCLPNEKRIDICFSPSKVCCAEREYED
ncbi:defensin beta 114 [Phyllostomus discolor]|uniref:Beta-defensin n=1 Tax=Phyllostomus discolor TaxID=89673 RepID=A0A6J2LGH9_9CHIR|nr:beta-defensin 114 [Phyllostomus discolor]XP_045698628.1 beta-defensin 114 [Phyllostomus hastatus]KAF6113443.1 defensin beta 114 [Phyllostomus discolor]